MKKLLASALLLLSLAVPSTASAASNDVLITAIQTESATSASEEYIVVANNSGVTIDVTGWHIQYFSATAASFDTPSRNIALDGLLRAGQGITAASSGYKTDVAKASFGAGLAAVGGHLRLVSGGGAELVQHDVVGWGTAIHPETTAIAAVTKGQTYNRRKVNNDFVDTDNNSSDFANPAAVPAAPAENTPEDTEEVTPDDVAVDAPIITELLPNPASPQTDANDEFVELYNPNDVAIDLTGYKLQTGSNYTYSYTFKSGSLAPQQYQAFYSSATKLTLSNTAGRARLLNPTGETVSETAAYGKAATGTSWILNGSAWAWTSVPTAAEANGAAVLAETSTAAKAAATKASKAATSKAKAATTAKAKATKSGDAATTYGDYKNPNSDNKALPVSPLLLAVVGVPLIGYMVYEYRHDLGNYFAKLRRNRSTGSEARAAAAGR